MTICSSGHGEVCYDEGPRNSARCPACEIVGKLEDAHETNSKLKFTIERLESEADERSAD